MELELRKVDEIPPRKKGPSGQMEFMGQIYSSTELGEMYGVNPRTIRKRYARGDRGLRLVRPPEPIKSTYVLEKMAKRDERLGIVKHMADTFNPTYDTVEEAVNAFFMEEESMMSSDIDTGDYGEQENNNYIYKG